MKNLCSLIGKRLLKRSLTDEEIAKTRQDVAMVKAVIKLVGYDSRRAVSLVSEIPEEYHPEVFNALFNLAKASYESMSERISCGELMISRRLAGEYSEDYYDFLATLSKCRASSNYL